ncbi:MAG: transcription-repair coupling factor [Bacteroidota bacterium]|nr:transcription-repair coupling factor [Candidatus Kapabacteria bacterium]MDW8074876.1 transcription-repair coupling factor [Bacteroidota bacterium]
MQHRIAPLEQVLERIRATDWYRTLSTRLRADQTTSVKTLHGSLGGFVIAALQPVLNRQLVVVTDTAEVERWVHDLRQFDIPAQQCIPGRRRRTDPEHRELQPALDALSAYWQERSTVLVLSPQSWQLRLPPPDWFSAHAIAIRRGDTLPFEDFCQYLILGGYHRSDYVTEAGEISIRGGIVDVFPLGWQLPLRFEFLGDTIESIREFDPLSQRSIRPVESAFLFSAYPRDEHHFTTTVEDFIEPSALVVIEHPEEVQRQFNEQGTVAHLDRFTRLAINPLGHADITVQSSPQPACRSAVAMLYDTLLELEQAGSLVLLCADSSIHLERLSALLRTMAEQRPAEEQLHLDRILLSPRTPDAGFLLVRDGIAVITEHEIFERRRAVTEQQSRTKLTLRQLQQLRRGDYLVHIDKGICQFDGLETIDIGGHKQECVRLLFADGDVVYLHLNYITKLERYSAVEGQPPALSKLGTREWERKKSRIKQKLKDLARDLIALYAKRKATPGFAFPPDTVWQTEMEASFMYEDTPDQARATQEVKRDMESPTPMDRLICGDVGFGKTEIAIRAAFKAVQAGKQVAVLVPTTILARQHYDTFRERLSRYPVRIELLSRMRTTAEQSAILRDLAEGKVDILIGTHRILSNDVRFRDLGLLIIDEEQRFGVAAKEKLRQMRVNIDTLTLTATPIPRTLNFSLMGARDLSIIETPPRNRLPIETEVLEWDEATLRHAITRELERGGQIFVVSDSIEGIPALQQRLLNLVPTLRIGIAHGQLSPSTLETVVERFLERKYDVLLATKIIENGLDMPNVNTIIIVNAERFGLAELYQLRGRVGRSNRQAYCYLVVQSLRGLNRHALERLRAIEEFTELGSGFQLALRDLELRGAGNIFGAEQSGYINEVGFETYHRILDEAIAELRAEEFAELFPQQERAYVNDAVAIELPTDALLPSSYIPLDTERFEWYKRLYRCSSAEELAQIREELHDRYGNLPPEAEQLLFGVHLRILGSRLGAERVRIEGSLMSIELPRSAPAWYYQETFPVLVAAAAEISGARFRQVNSLAVLDVPIASPAEAVAALERLWSAVQTLRQESGTRAAALRTSP